MSDIPPPVTSPDMLFEDLQKYRRRRRWLEKQIFTLTREKDQIDAIELAISQAYNINREGEKELKRFEKPPQKRTERMFDLKCVDCGSDFQANWRGKKYCRDCAEKRPSVVAAQRNGKLSAITRKRAVQA